MYNVTSAKNPVKSDILDSIILLSSCSSRLIWQFLSGFFIILKNCPFYSPSSQFFVYPLHEDNDDGESLFFFVCVEGEMERNYSYCVSIEWEKFTILSFFVLSYVAFTPGLSCGGWWWWSCVLWYVVQHQNPFRNSLLPTYIHCTLVVRCTILK